MNLTIKSILSSKLGSVLILASTTCFLIGCSSGHCRTTSEQTQNLAKQAHGEKTATPVTDTSHTAPTGDKLAETVFVYQYDGSLQCGLGEAIAVDKMAEQLKGIEIIAMINRHDGLMHMTVCGSSTGQANVYKVYKQDLPEAEKRGFKLWKFD